MAMSLSQPDPASPASVADASFGTARRGFDQGQVRDFLRMVAAELGRSQERERFLERELRVAQSNPDLDAAQLDDAALTRLLGEETARVLSTARESAREIREKAEEHAARMVAEASEEAARVREQADLDAARVRADATADAESEIEMAKQQGRDMVTEARAYRERVLSELARRRELAREQIEQLIHGRDRLIQAFERARLAAVDVVSELEPLGEPSEYVNLTPTTGPVPVMVPSARPESQESSPTEALPRTLDPAVESADADGTGEGAPNDEATDLGAEDASTEDDGDDEVTDEAEAEAAPADEAEAGEDAENADESAGDDAAADETGQTAEEAEADSDRADAEADDTDGADGEPSAEPTAEADDEAHDVEPSDEAHDDLASADEEADDEADDRAAEAEDDATAAPGDEADGEERDDVVVDLFARLRAGAASTTAETVDDDTGDLDTDDIETGSAAEGDAPAAAASEAAVDATLVGDLEGGEEADGDEVEDDESPFRRRDADLTPLIVASARKLKRVLADEQNAVLEVLRADAGVRQLDEIVPDCSEQASRYAESITDELAEAARAGARSIADDHELADDDVAAAREAAVEMVTDWLVIPLRDRLERCVDEGDGDNVAISRRIRSVYREWKTQHIDEQLDDVLRAAYGRGALGAADGDTTLVWLVDREHPACPDCDDNSLSPPVTAGEPFPTGHTFAPAHPGCRCLVAVPDR